MTPSPKAQAPVRITQGRVKSNTPPIVPGHHHQAYNSHACGRRSTVDSVKEKPKEIDYFAGAKFDCLPSVSSLPTPPAEWTIPVLRSQSQPSSPVTTTTSGVRIDVSSLFLTPQVNKVSHHEPASKSHPYHNNSKQSGNNKTRKMMKQQQKDEIDTHNNAKTVQEKKVTTTTTPQRKEDTKSGHAKHNNSKYSKQDKSAMFKSTSSSPKVESKPINIATPYRGSYQHKEMYPHLTESLRCLLKVQG